MCTLSGKYKYTFKLKNMAVFINKNKNNKDHCISTQSWVEYIV